MKKQNIWKRYLVFILLVMLSVMMTACGEKDSEPEEVQDVEPAEEVVEEEVQDIQDSWIKIKPTENGTVVFDNIEDRSEDVEPGNIIKQLNASDYQLIISKPILPEELQTAINEAGYNYIEISQLGSTVDPEHEHHRLIIFYADDLKVFAYNDIIGNVGRSQQKNQKESNFDWDHSAGWDNWNDGPHALDEYIIPSDDGDGDIYVEILDSNFGSGSVHEIASFLYEIRDILME